MNVPYTLLGLLEREPSHGYELKRDYDTVVVATSGSSAVIEQTRTALAAAFPDQRPPATLAEERMLFAGGQELAGLQQLANVVIVVSLCIAGCSLAVSVVAGLNDRKRPFSLLRLCGVRLATLRRIVILETASPLLTVAVLTTGSAFLASQLFLRSQMDYAMRAPGVAYWFAVGAGMAVCLGVIGCTLPLLNRITGPETARNE
ncbi:MAG: FtsX-like permease family protein [Candidatus Nanopelagicales bacterium]